MLCLRVCMSMHVHVLKQLNCFKVLLAGQASKDEEQRCESVQADRAPEYAKIEPATHAKEGRELLCSVWM